MTKEKVVVVVAIFVTMCVWYTGIIELMVNYVNGHWWPQNIIKEPRDFTTVATDATDETTNHSECTDKKDNNNHAKSHS